MRQPCMLNAIISLMFCICVFLQLSALTPLPTLIDFGKYPTMANGYYAEVDQDAFEMGNYSFNYSPELLSVFAILKKDYQIPTVVETGTFRGGTTLAFSLLFDNVHTIEIDPINFLTAKEKLRRHSNIQFYLGSSDKVLVNLLPLIREQRVLFYLDAHWQAHWPLLQELELISKTHKDNCIIVVDDFKVPGRSEIPFDGYGNAECSLEYIQSKLEQVFTSYSVHFLIPKSVEHRAKLVAIPKQWKNM